MDLTTMLNTASAAPNTGETTDRFVPAPVMPRDEDGGTSLPSILAPPSETLTVRPGTEARPSSGNKKPWDANGYTMPPVGNLSSAPAPAPAPARPFYNSFPQSPNQKLPEHKFSDSYSSLSSFASPSTSLPHSRYSSMSTTGDIQITGFAPQLSPLEPRWDCPSYTSPGETADKASVYEFGRLDSPSDSMLISKSLRTPDQISTRGTTSEMEVISNFRYGIPPHLDSTKAHKRTASAPSQGVNSPSQPYSFIPHFDFQPTTPTFQSGQQALNGIMESPHTSPGATTESLTQDNALFPCMYCANCDTRSAPRKVVSHIFGRNKLCTRMIPDHIWVHFCRKHYQRSRYRNGQEYTRLQCELVLTQIERVQRWSDDNKKNGRAEVVKDWTLSMRKREQNRIQDRVKKRLHSDMCDEEDNNDNAAEDDDNNPNHPDRAKRDSNPVPDWLRHMCREGYGTQEIIRVVDRINNDIADGRLQQIPDIEILPNIPTEGAQPAKSMTLCGRRKLPNGLPHKRSQSLGVTGQRRHPSSMIQRRDSVLCRPSTSSPSFPPADKRQRTLDTIPYHEPSPFTSTRDVSVVTPALRPTSHLPYGITFPREPLIQESHAEEPCYDSQAVGESHYTWNKCLLPNPAPSRPADAPMQTLLEPNAPGPSRIAHQRSVSEYANRLSTMGSGFQIARPSPLAPSAPIFAEIHHLHPAPSPTISFETNRDFTALTNPRFLDTRCRLLPNASLPPSTYLQQPVDRSRHSRHQSTPNANPSVFSHLEAHPLRQVNASGNVYGVPAGLGRISSAPNIPIRHPPGQLVSFVPQPEQMTSPYAEQR